LNLIRAVAAGSPCAVGVDIDTSDPDFSDFANLKFECPVIWARAAQYSNRDNRFLPSNIFGKPGPVALNQGLSVFTPDDDGLLRRYSRVVRSSQGDVPTFPWSILLSAHLSGDLRPSADFMLIRFLLPPSKSRRPGLIRIGAREMLELSKLPTWKDGILKGKVTLIGGDYDVADEHDTPAGFIFGIDLIADALQTELRGGGRRPPSTWLTFAIAFVAAAIYWITMRNLSWKQISVFGPLLVLLQAAICSWILAGSLSLVPLFTIVLAAVFAYQIWNHLNEKKEARER
jgi:CHASE2 domain-containing sensor protein